MKYRIFTSALAFAVIFLSCERVKHETKTLDFELFTVQVPENWEKIMLKGIDSYVAQIAIDDTDTLTFDLGWYSNDLTEQPVYDISEGKVYLLNETKSTWDSTVYEYIGSADTIDVRKLMKDSVSWTTIDNRRAKIVLPKKSGVGTTGVYIDSLWKAGSGIDKFQMNGRNLKPENERLFLQAIRTLRFNRK